MAQCYPVILRRTYFDSLSEHHDDQFYINAWRIWWNPLDGRHFLLRSSSTGTAFIEGAAGLLHIMFDGLKETSEEKGPWMEHGNCWECTEEHGKQTFFKSKPSLLLWVQYITHHNSKNQTVYWSGRFHSHPLPFWNISWHIFQVDRTSRRSLSRTVEGSIMSPLARSSWSSFSREAQTNWLPLNILAKDQKKDHFSHMFFYVQSLGICWNIYHLPLPNIFF